MDDAVSLIQQLEAVNPRAAALARWSCIPVRVAPAFLRLARLRMVPDGTSGDEADLWLSDLVESRSGTGYAYRSPVREALRTALRQDLAALDHLWQTVHQEHAPYLTPYTRLEEELTWRLLRDRADPMIESLWAGVVHELDIGDNVEGVARWATRAVQDLPPGTLDHPSGRRAIHGAHLMLGDASLLGIEPRAFLDSGEFAFATRRLPRQRIQVGMLARGVVASMLAPVLNGHEIDVPATRPLWVQLEQFTSLESPDLTQVILLDESQTHIKQEWPVPLGGSHKDLILRTIDGMAWRMRLGRKESSQKFIKRSSLSLVQIEYDVELYGAVKKVQLPFVMGVMAELSGKPAEQLPAIADRRFLEIDVDNFDDRLKAMKPRLAFQVADSLTGEGALRIDLTFESMDDFSPAAVARRVDPLNNMLEARQQLANLMSYMDGMDGKEDAEELISKVLNDPALLQTLATEPKPADDLTSDSSRDAKQTRIESVGIGYQTSSKEEAQQLSGTTVNLADFAALLEKVFRPRSDQAKLAVESAVQTLAQQVLAGIVPRSEDLSKTIEDVITAIDKKLTEQINQILHHKDFTSLEGAWRGLHYLVNNTETDEMLKIRVMNISKTDLHSTLKEYTGTDWEQSPIFKKIYEEEFGQFGGEPYGCLVGDYYFDHSSADVDLLGKIAKISAAAHAPFIAAASPAVLQMDSWQELSNPRDTTRIFQNAEYADWQSLRESEDARYIGLAMPRFLARAPYGAKTNPVEDFDFEEDVEGAAHETYIWGNAAYAMAVNINRAFRRYGWCATIRGVESGGAVGNLPVHIFPTADGGFDMKGPTEISISDRREAELAKNGFMPLVHRKNSDFAAFISDQSLQNPPEYDDPDATANANLAARLPYLFTSCRFAHYLKCIARDKIGSFSDASDMQRYLNNWIMQYVDGHPASSSEQSKALRPLAVAEVDIEDEEGNSGDYLAKFYLMPHYQLEGLTVALRLVSKLPSVKAA